MKELVGNSRDDHTRQLADALRDSDTLPQSSSDVGSADTFTQSENSSLADGILITEDAPPNNADVRSCDNIVIDGSLSSTTQISDNDPASKLIVSDDIDVKREELQDGKRFLTFTTEEDKFLREGIVKHGKSRKKWSDIINDSELKFQEGRTRDALRVRATTLGLEKGKRKAKKQNIHVV